MAWINVAWINEAWINVAWINVAWINLIHSKVQWRDLVKEVMNLQVT